MVLTLSRELRDTSQKPPVGRFPGREGVDPRPVVTPRVREGWERERVRTRERTKEEGGES